MAKKPSAQRRRDRELVQLEQKLHGPVDQAAAPSEAIRQQYLLNTLTQQNEDLQRQLNDQVNSLAMIDRLDGEMRRIEEIAVRMIQTGEALRQHVRTGRRG